MILATVKGQSLKINHPKVVADTIAYLEMTVQFKTPDWDGLRKFVHFTLGEKTYTFELVNDQITRDMHLDLPEGEWEVYIHGAEYQDLETVQRITTEPVTLYVYRTGSLDGEPFPELTGSEGEKVKLTAEKALEIAEDLQKSLGYDRAPDVRVNSETNEWEISYDEGKNWFSLKITTTSDFLPLVDGEASAGKSDKYSREDHVHPTDTSRASVKALEDETKRAEDAEAELLRNKQDNLSFDREYDAETNKVATVQTVENEKARATEAERKLDSRIDTVESIAKGATQAKSYPTYADLIAELNTLPQTAFNIGQDFYIATKGVPDLWVSDVSTTSVPYEWYTTEEEFADYIKEYNNVKIGYFILSEGEGPKVVLTNYPTKKELEDEITRAKDAEEILTKAVETANKHAQNAVENATATLNTAEEAKTQSGNTAQYLQEAIDTFLEYVGILAKADREQVAALDAHKQAYDNKMALLDQNDTTHNSAIASLHQNKQDNLAFDGEYDADSNKVATVKTVADKVAEIIAGADENFDTLKELADWLNTHGAEAAEMNSAIEDLKKSKENKGEITVNSGKDKVKLFVDTVEAYEALEDKDNVLAFFTNDPMIANLNTMANGIEKNEKAITNTVKQKAYSTTAYVPNFNDGDCARAYVRSSNGTEDSILVSKYIKAHSLALRDQSGRLFTGKPEDKNHCVNKDYVDGEVTKIQDGTTPVGSAKELTKSYYNFTGSTSLDLSAGSILIATVHPVANETYAAPITLFIPISSGVSTSDIYGRKLLYNRSTQILSLKDESGNILSDRTVYYRII